MSRNHFLPFIPQLPHSHSHPHLHTHNAHLSLHPHPHSHSPILTNAECDSAQPRGQGRHQASLAYHHPGIHTHLHTPLSTRTISGQDTTMKPSHDAFQLKKLTHCDSHHSLCRKSSQLLLLGSMSHTPTPISGPTLASWADWPLSRPRPPSCSVSSTLW